LLLRKKVPAVSRQSRPRRLPSGAAMIVGGSFPQAMARSRGPTASRKTFSSWPKPCRKITSG
jgi:hypothetical protein